VSPYSASLDLGDERLGILLLENDRLFVRGTRFWQKMAGARARPKSSIPAAHFEAKYRADIDPWGFRTSEYEQQKYRATIDALSRRRYQRALELGCGIGTLSTLLAPRCGHVLALDGSRTAIAEAQRQNVPNVDFEVACLPDDFPTGRFDLIVLSEFLYYFSAADLKIVPQRCVDALDQGGRDDTLPLARADS
jgi:SAM-dependent methyltransferase